MIRGVIGNSVDNAALMPPLVQARKQGGFGRVSGRKTNPAGPNGQGGPIRWPAPPCVVVGYWVSFSIDRFAAIESNAAPISDPVAS